MKRIGKDILSYTNTHAYNSLVFAQICIGKAKGENKFQYHIYEKEGRGSLTQNTLSRII